MKLPELDNYQELFLNDTPLMDVRAPVEFDQGAFPRAANLPLINDEERHEIGIRYKDYGQDEAIALGHELVRGETREQRLHEWSRFVNQHPQGALYCFRGGMRSKITQQWIYEETGQIYPRIKGGYKALRRYLMDEIDRASTRIQPVILGGRTGTGKTQLLTQIRQAIDLEGIYQHRGSAFGQRLQPQPSQIHVENTLAVELLKHRHRGHHTLVFEDEARNIGSRNLPDALYHSMQQAPLVIIEAELHERVNIVFQEYITKALTEYQTALGEQAGFEAWATGLSNALDKIQRRLGGARHKVLRAIMDNALQQQRDNGHAEGHKEWIETLLSDYYDPMYDYQLGKKTERIVFRGDAKAVLEYLHQQHHIG